MFQTSYVTLKFRNYLISVVTDLVGARESVRGGGGWLLIFTDAVSVIKFENQSAHVASVYRTFGLLNSPLNIHTQILLEVNSLKQNKVES